MCMDMRESPSNSQATWSHGRQSIKDECDFNTIPAYLCEIIISLSVSLSLSVYIYIYYMYVCPQFRVVTVLVEFIKFSSLRPSNSLSWVIWSSAAGVDLRPAQQLLIFLGLRNNAVFLLFLLTGFAVDLPLKYRAMITRQYMLHKHTHHSVTQRNVCEIFDRVHCWLRMNIFV